MLRHEAPRGLRVNWGFVWITSLEGWWWSNEKKRWVRSGDMGTMGGSNTFQPCRSVRAFRRRLREWSHYLPKETKFILVSRWKGYDVRGATN